MLAFYRIFYLALGFVAYRNFFRNDLLDAHALMLEPTGVLSLVSPDVLGHTNFQYVLGALLLFCLLNAINTNFVLRVGAALSFLILTDMKNSFGKINHELHGWLYAALVLIFLNYGKKDRIKFVIEIVQTVILATYFTAGLWKLRSILNHDDFFSYFANIKDRVAYSIAEGSGPSPFLMNSWLLNSDFLALGFAGVFLFQISSVIPIAFQMKKIWVWGLMAMMFHFAVGFIMNIWFIDQILLVALFLIAVPCIAPLTLSKIRTFLKLK